MMMKQSRRSLLSALGLALPFGLGARIGASPSVPSGAAPVLRFRPFEDLVREAFADEVRDGRIRPDDHKPMPRCRRVEVGHSDQIRAGVQGCHNDRPFAGFPEGHLRIVQTGSEPGPIWQGVRLYVSTVDIAPTGGLPAGDPSRPLDFASLPPAPTLSWGVSPTEAGSERITRPEV